MGNTVVIPSFHDWYSQPLKKQRIVLIDHFDAGQFFLVFNGKTSQNKDIIIKAYEYNEPLKNLKVIKESENYFKKLSKHSTEIPGIVNFSYLIQDNIAFLFRPKFEKSFNFAEFCSYQQPILEPIEKLFIFYQIFNIIKSLHNIGLAHGDLKPSNIFVNGHDLDICIVDPAPFKPNYILESRLHVFYHYFTTSSESGCYLAPERISGIFQNNQYDHDHYQTKSSSPQANSIKNQNYSTENQRKKDNDGNKDDHNYDPNQIDLKMADIFSFGCIIAFLYLNGEHIFDLSKLHQYVNGKIDIRKELESIEDEDVINIIIGLISLDIEERRETMRKLDLLFDDFFPIFSKLFCELRNDQSFRLHPQEYLPMLTKKIRDLFGNGRLLLFNFFFDQLLKMDRVQSIIYLVQEMTKFITYTNPTNQEQNYDSNSEKDSFSNNSSDNPFKSIEYPENGGISSTIKLTRAIPLFFATINNNIGSPCIFRQCIFSILDIFKTIDQFPPFLKDYIDIYLKIELDKIIGLSKGNYLLPILANVAPFFIYRLKRFVTEEDLLPISSTFSSIFGQGSTPYVFSIFSHSMITIAHLINHNNAVIYQKQMEQKSQADKKSKIHKHKDKEKDEKKKKKDKEKSENEHEEKDKSHMHKKKAKDHSEKEDKDHKEKKKDKDKPKSERDHSEKEEKSHKEKKKDKDKTKSETDHSEKEEKSHKEKKKDKDKEKNDTECSEYEEKGHKEKKKAKDKEKEKEKIDTECSEYEEKGHKEKKKAKDKEKEEIDTECSEYEEKKKPKAKSETEHSEKEEKSHKEKKNGKDKSETDHSEKEEKKHKEKKKDKDKSKSETDHSEKEDKIHKEKKKDKDKSKSETDHSEKEDKIHKEKKKDKEKKKEKEKKKDKEKEKKKGKEKTPKESIEPLTLYRYAYSDDIYSDDDFEQFDPEPNDSATTTSTSPIASTKSYYKGIEVHDYDSQNYDSGFTVLNSFFFYIVSVYNNTDLYYKKEALKIIQEFYKCSKYNVEDKKKYHQVFCETLFPMFQHILTREVSAIRSPNNSNNKGKNEEENELVYGIFDFLTCLCESSKNIYSLSDVPLDPLSMFSYSLGYQFYSIALDYFRKTTNPSVKYYSYQFMKTLSIQIKDFIFVESFLGDSKSLPRVVSDSSRPDFNRRVSFMNNGEFWVLETNGKTVSPVKKLPLITNENYGIQIVKNRKTLFNPRFISSFHAGSIPISHVLCTSGICIVIDKSNRVRWISLPQIPEKVAKDELKSNIEVNFNFLFHNERFVNNVQQLSQIRSSMLREKVTAASMLPRFTSPFNSSSFLLGYENGSIDQHDLSTCQKSRIFDGFNRVFLTSRSSNLSRDSISVPALNSVALNSNILYSTLNQPSANSNVLNSPNNSSSITSNSSNFSFCDYVSDSAVISISPISENCIVFANKRGSVKLIDIRTSDSLLSLSFDSDLGGIADLCNWNGIMIGVGFSAGAFSLIDTRMFQPFLLNVLKTNSINKIIPMNPMHDQISYQNKSNAGLASSSFMVLSDDNEQVADVYREPLNKVVLTYNCSENANMNKNKIRAAVSFAGGVVALDDFSASFVTLNTQRDATCHKHDIYQPRRIYNNYILPLQRDENENLEANLSISVPTKSLCKMESVHMHSGTITCACSYNDRNTKNNSIISCDDLGFVNLWNVTSG